MDRSQATDISGFRLLPPEALVMIKTIYEVEHWSISSDGIETYRTKSYKFSRPRQTGLISSGVDSHDCTHEYRVRILAILRVSIPDTASRAPPDPHGNIAFFLTPEQIYAYTAEAMVRRARDRDHPLIQLIRQKSYFKD